MFWLNQTFNEVEFKYLSEINKKDWRNWDWFDNNRFEMTLKLICKEFQVYYKWISNWFAISFKSKWVLNWFANISKPFFNEFQIDFDFIFSDSQK